MPGGLVPAAQHTRHPAGELHGRLGLPQQLFTWWPLALLAAFGLGLWIARLSPDSALRKLLVAMQWLLTLASLALLTASLYLVFLPRMD